MERVTAAIKKHYFWLLLNTHTHTLICGTCMSVVINTQDMGVMSFDQVQQHSVRVPVMFGQNNSSIA